MSTKPSHFVLVHGIMHGAWCWYKIVDLLQREGHKVTAINLKSAGSSPHTADSIESFEEYNQPLIQFLADLPPTEKVVLVGHSFGGVSLASASEEFPHKIAAAVYVSALMIRGGDCLQHEIEIIQLDKEITDQWTYNFGKGTDQLPTSLFIPTELQKYLFYGMSPPSDVALASLCLRPFPHNALTNISLRTSEENYGMVPRVYVMTEKDNIVLPKYQKLLIEGSPPEHVYSLDCDHSPFFSQPHALQRLLLEIAIKYDKTAH